jgi:hypothetical protein
MALPLPRVVADVGPGGPAVTSLRGMNALINDIYGNQIKKVQAEYAPTTVPAEAASKWAYANLMGPQFIAKLMGNPDVVANSPQLQNPQTINTLYQAGTGQGLGNPFLTMPGVPQQNQGGLLGHIVNGVRNAFGFGGQQPQNAMSQPPQMIPRQEAIARANADQQRADMREGQAIPQQTNAIIPQAPMPSAGQNTYAENAGQYAGVKAEGAEAGKIRANDIKELADTVFNGETKQATLDDLTSMVTSPVIQEIRQLPLAGRHEMGWYAKEGTKEQKELVGRLYTQMGNLVKDSSRDFAGQFRKGEQQLLNGMKPNDSDTVDVMIGKIQSLSTMNKLLTERARLVAHNMNNYHMNKLDASELADKQLKGDNIRKQVYDSLHPTITIRNPRTGERITIPIEDARKGGFKGA